LGGPGGIADQVSRPDDKRNVPHLNEQMVELGRQMAVLEQVLADGREYVAGRYSIADMQLYPAIRRGVAYGVIQPSPSLKRWLARIGERPAVRSANPAQVAV
jgi:glutathione S-transferase